MSVLFCDSNCELWYDILEKNNVKLIKMPYSIDGTEYYYDCGKETDFKNFYRRVREKSLPTTAALNNFNYIDIFEPYFKAGEDILYVSFSSEMSATFTFLDIAVKELKKKYPKAKFTRFDTRFISLGAGVLVYNAINLKNQGKSNEEIVKKLTVLREKAAIYFVVDDLNHLKRGGRISASAAIMGGLLNIKPILSMENGRLKTFEKVKGRKRALTELVAKIETEWDRNYEDVWILSADCDDDQNFVEAEMKNRIKDKIELRKQPIGPVIGTHCGPDTLGIAFIKKDFI